MQTGQEFRDDRRPIEAADHAKARAWLLPDELAPLTRLSWGKALLALGLTSAWLLGLISLGFWALGQGAWAWVAVAVLGVGVQQHALFILNHEAAHYRLLPNRRANDWVGTVIGSLGGVSMHTYRVTHRLHHNHLYGPQDPDTAIHGGYPRGKAYLWRKLAQDLTGWNAWKTYAYFFGAPAINAQTGTAIDPLNDTSEPLRQAARADRIRVIGVQLALPIAIILLATNPLNTLANPEIFVKIGQAYLLFWMLPLLTVLQPILRLRAICEHGAVTDLRSPLTAARCVKTWGNTPNVLGRMLLFPHHVNHHLEHHLYPAVPHYNLPALHALLHQKGALHGAQVRDLATTLREIFAPKRPKQVSTPLKDSP